MSHPDVLLVEQQQQQSGPSRDPRRVASSPPPLRSNTSHSSTTKPPQHRLGFTSDLPRGPPPEYNPDGSPSLEYLAYQSTCQLKSRWDSILDRYSCARHDDDEVMFGGGKGAVPRLVKDAGMLRKLDSGADFGSFYLRDEDMVEMLQRLKRAAALPCPADDADRGETDELDEWSAAFFKSQFVSLRPEEGEEEQESKGTETLSKPIDPDLQEFLLAEQKRREMCGDEDDDDDDDEDDDAYTSDSDAATVSYDATATLPARPPPTSTSTLYLAGPGTYSTSDDDLDVLDEDELDEYDLMMIDKRRHVEDVVAGWSEQDLRPAPSTKMATLPEPAQTQSDEGIQPTTVLDKTPPEEVPEDASFSQVDSRSPTPSAVPLQRPAPRYRSRLLNHSLLRRQRLSLGQSVAEVG